MNLFVKATGAPIVGTLEIIHGRANTDGFTRNADGSFEPDYAGYTEVFWDDQKTVHRNGSPVYLTEDGFEYTADEVELRDEADADEERDSEGGEHD